MDLLMAPFLLIRPAELQPRRNFSPDSCIAKHDFACDRVNKSVDEPLLGGAGFRRPRRHVGKAFYDGVASDASSAAVNKSVDEPCLAVPGLDGRAAMSARPFMTA